MQGSELPAFIRLADKQGYRPYAVLWLAFGHGKVGGVCTLVLTSCRSRQHDAFRSVEGQLISNWVDQFLFSNAYFRPGFSSVDAETYVFGQVVSLQSSTLWLVIGDG